MLKKKKKRYINRPNERKQNGELLILQIYK